MTGDFGIENPSFGVRGSVVVIVIAVVFGVDVREVGAELGELQSCGVEEPRLLPKGGKCCNSLLPITEY